MGIHPRMRLEGQGRGLDDHRQVHPGDDLDLRREVREAEIRGRPPEHVGEDQHAVALVGWDDTVVIVSADHGEGLWEHGFIGHNVQVYEPSARIPLIVRQPGAPAARAGRPLRTGARRRRR